MKISLIAALASNRVIGNQNQLPWHLPEDLRYFRRTTRGYPVIMGRKTFESIGKPLPDRQNIVITRQAELRYPGCTMASSLEEALRLAEVSRGEVFVLGGAEIYRQAIKRADRLYLTLIEREFEGDAVFPEWRDLGFRETRSEAQEDPISGIRFRFTLWDRATPAQL